MKRLIMLFAFAITSLAAHAQFQAGVKAGLSTANVEIHAVRNDPWQYAKAENVTGYHAGAFARVQFGGLFIQPEAILTSTGGKVEVSSDDNTMPVHIEDIKFNRLDVPIMIGYSFFNMLRVQAGPVSSSLLSARQEDDDIKEYMETSDWGLQAGLGLDLGPITADVRYERINRHFSRTAQDNTMQYNNQQFIVSLGYKLLR
ncbi:porin family protein [Pontibacter sp. CAU 1760]